MKRIFQSLTHINYRLYFALLVLGLCPTIYTTVRVFFLGQLPGEWTYSIAGQLSWINLFYEILNEAIILPLFFFIGKVVTDKKEFANRVKSGLLVTLCIYLLFSAFIIVAAKPLLYIMATDATIINASASYIRIESVANIFTILAQFTMVALVTLGKSKSVYIMTGIKLILCLLFDTFLVSTLPFSLQLGINGIGYSNILVNAVLLVSSLALLARESNIMFSKERLYFTWMKDFAKIGSISGLESFVRNIAYMLMIVRMVNMVSEQGTYWVANNFIWGWLLLPITQLAELIKQEVAIDHENAKRNASGYFTITTGVCILWFLTIPLWKPFMTNILGFSDVEKLFELVMILIGFYVLYAFQNVFDATFYGLGKTHYMLFESVVTNTIYYGIAFILYLTGALVPSLTGIALLFGIGNAFDAVVSLGAYIYLRRHATK